MPKEKITAKPDEFKINDRWFHLMPILSADDSATMRKSIELIGVQEPISVLPDMTIVDGHQRWTLVKFNPHFPQEIPYEVAEELAEATEEDIIDYILIKNMERRHLTSWQKHDVYRDVKERLVKTGKVRSLANLKQGDKIPEVDDTSISGGGTRKILAERFGIPEETQKLAKALDETEDYDTKALLSKGEITQADAWRRVRKNQGKPNAGKPKPLFYLIRRGGLQWTQFFVLVTAIFKHLFNETTAKELIRCRIDFPEKKEADAIDAESNKTWKPAPFKGWSCVHNVVGGCWRCFPELTDGGHRRKTSSHKADEVHIPVDRAELGGFTVLPDKDMQACHKCEELWDDLNGRCKWKEGTKVPDGCRKLAHRR